MKGGRITYICVKEGGNTYVKRGKEDTYVNTRCVAEFAIDHSISYLHVRKI